MGSFKTSSAAGVTDNSATDSATPTNSSTQTETDIHIFDAPLHLHDSPPYAEAEKVFAYHSTRLYEAKVSQVEYKHNRWRFFVHYLGWKKSWDEWVGMDRLMKHTEENMHKKLALDEKYGNDKNTKIPRASLTKSKSSNVYAPTLSETFWGKCDAVARGRKRKNEYVIKGKPVVNPDKLVNIQIPPTLKKQLVDDCEFITHLGKLVKLPRTPNVNDILKKYFDYRLKKCGLIAGSVEEIMKGLCCYFDKALPVMLLYKNERQQYQEACPNNIIPSTIYGAEHLLRLFVKLPELLFHASIEEQTLIELQAQLVEFLRFLQRNQSTFFLSTYHVPEDIENSTNKQGD